MGRKLQRTEAVHCYLLRNVLFIYLCIYATYLLYTFFICDLYLYERSGEKKHFFSANSFEQLCKYNTSAAFQ